MSTVRDESRYYSSWKSRVNRIYPDVFKATDKAGFIFTDEQINLIKLEDKPQAFFMEKIMEALGKIKVDGEWVYKNPPKESTEDMPVSIGELMGGVVQHSMPEPTVRDWWDD